MPYSPIPFVWHFSLLNKIVYFLIYFKKIWHITIYMYASIDYYLSYICKPLSYIEYCLRCVNKIITQNILI
jgi:hypothetical protein